MVYGNCRIFVLKCVFITCWGESGAAGVNDVVSQITKLTVVSKLIVAKLIVVQLAYV